MDINDFTISTEDMVKKIKNASDEEINNAFKKMNSKETQNALQSLLLADPNKCNQLAIRYNVLFFESFIRG